MELIPIPTSRELGQLRAYCAQEVDEFLAFAAGEREKLRDTVAAAHARLLLVRAQLAARTAVRDRFGDMVLEAQHAALSRRADLELAVSGIVESAEMEAEAIVAAARAEAAALRSTFEERLATTKAAQKVEPVIDLAKHLYRVG